MTAQLWSGNNSRSHESETKLIGAVDIGGTKIAVGVVDEDGHLLSCVESPTYPDRGYAPALERTTAMLKKAAEMANCQISGIGIGSTGPVDPIAGQIGNVNFFPEWEGQNPVRDLETRFQVRVAMENDADAAALGEFGWGAGRNKSRLIYVTVGTGIGGGVILDGELYRGVQNAHPEFGHHLIDPSGPACLCGFRGCWESLAAGPAMVTWLKSAAPNEYPHLRELSAKLVCQLAREGDALARQAVERETYYLGVGLANLVTLFAPDAIVLGGSVMKSADLFLPGIRKQIGESCCFVPWQRTELSLASLGENANLIGAARVWYHRFKGGRGAH
jgi:glucokinase